ncbi:MerR family DNA-binding protein [Colwellia sp. MB3u-70]|uniref:MerR family transcriptional regulator n=1 Tax=unclassified Colwellia TaxID=196834 RepID=UPI0015F55075|nr:MULTISPECIES: MerR family DNA-binding protein [unclassified Colwellia]MBA6291187.1 MerR family DNA-binding protein [Colwellia sp. MB3u-8]MBA6305912.1 MerR family DNA-binding protein [Colwellia sp. MB3u-70]
MTVTELANAINTTPDTVRYYTKMALITARKNPNNGYKIYGKSAQNRLKFILSARQLNFSVAEIKSILIEADKGHSACPLVRDIVEHHLTETEQQFQAALLLREKLSKAINDWQDKADKTPTGDMICHLIESADNTDQGGNNE